MINFRHYPMMEDYEVEALFNVFETRKPKSILEWGCGGSTLFWPYIMPELPWISIEHDRIYYEYVRKYAQKNVKVFLFSFPEYYELSNFHDFYDIIIVDGRARVKCLDRARSLLSLQGAVILHDYTRERYRPAFSYYNVIEKLSPPKDGKDPRGLIMFRGPKDGK